MPEFDPDTLSPDEMLIAEYNYIAQTAFQANEDRSRVTSFYFVSVGSLVAFLAPLTAVQRQLSALGGVALGTRPDGWRWGGMIYYAPDDPALFIPKRFGIGQTFNFARPAAWLILVLLVVAPIGIAFTSMLLSRR